LIKSGIPADKIFYAPAFYIDLDIFHPDNSEKKYDLIFVGRLTENKGTNLFLKAARRLGAKAVIVGDGPLKKRIQSEIRDDKLEDKIILKGWVGGPEEVAKLLNESKILIMPSYNEGGPRVVLEAMACGVPVVATPVGIVSDIIEDDKAGGIISWDEKRIADKARELLGDKEKYEMCKTNGLLIARQFEKREAVENYAKALFSFI
jgi:glycosyltransferase involved in cell wall biosynthesis